LVKEKTGISLVAFGLHWRGTTAATVDALKDVPAIKIAFYYTAGAKGDWFVNKRFMELKQPNFASVKKRFEGGECRGHIFVFRDIQTSGVKNVLRISSKLESILRNRVVSL
jgi:hypothetical protein